MLTIVLGVTALICYLALIYTYKPAATFRNGMLFAVTLPAHAMEHEAIRSVQARFANQFRNASIWMGLGLIPFVLLHVWLSYQIIYFFVWLLVFILWMAAPFRRAFRDTLALKREHEWFVGNKRMVLGDLRVAQAKNKRSASLWLFTIPLALSVGNMLWVSYTDVELAGAASGGVILTALLFFMSLYLRRTKAKVYSMNTEVNMALNQARRRAISYLLLFLAIEEAIRFVFISMLMQNNNAELYGVWIALILLLTVIPIVLVIAVYRSIQAREQEVLAQDGKVVYTDDDEYWANGFTYHNPDDSSIFVPKRIGIGDTVNTGMLVGKLIMWGSVGIAAVAIIGVSFMLIRSELTSPVLSVTPEHKVAIAYPMYSFDFTIADIQELKLVDEVPPGTKTNGEATDTYARGHFRLSEVGKARLYIFRNNPPYIRIKLTDGYVYYNEKDPLKTQEQFELLQKQSGK